MNSKLFVFLVSFVLYSTFVIASEPAFFTVDSTITPKSIKKGKVASLVIKLTALQSTKINEEAPVSLEIKPGPELSTARLRFSRIDAKRAEKHYAEWDIPLTAIKTGTAIIRGSVSFYLCTDKWCRKFEHIFSEKLVVES